MKIITSPDVKGKGKGFRLSVPLPEEAYTRYYSASQIKIAA